MRARRVVAHQRDRLIAGITCSRVCRITESADMIEDAMWRTLVDKSMRTADLGGTPTHVREQLRVCVCCVWIGYGSSILTVWGTCNARVS